MTLTATASFPGISVIKGFSFTLGQGISPSVATIKTVPHSRFVASVGELKITFGKTTLKFPDCSLDRASLRISPDGQLWSIQIKDRRWKWAFGHVSGFVNKRNADGSLEREFAPQKIAALLLDRMGEQKFDVSKLPNKARPQMEFDHTNPARALADLCDRLSCRVVLGTDNRVRIERIGQGKDLPENGMPIAAGGFGFKTSTVPDSIELIGAPLLFSSLLKLEAIGPEIKGPKAGDLLPIDELSWRPAGGWADSPRFDSLGHATYIDEEGVEQFQADLASITIYRTYRVKEQYGKSTLQPPGYKGKVKRIAQLLPLFDALPKMRKMPDGSEEPKPARVGGRFLLDPEDDVVSHLGALYTGEWSLDGETGIVTFADPVTKLAGGKHVEADVVLLCSYNVTDDRGRLVRFTHERKLPVKNNTLPMLLEHEDVERRLIQRYEKNLTPKVPVEDNLADATKDADHYIDAVVDSFRTEPSTAFEYAGIVDINPDGAIVQVSWSFSDSQPAMTRASRNEEWNRFVPTLKEKRRIEKAEAREAKERRDAAKKRRKKRA